MTYDEIRDRSREIICEFLPLAKLRKGQILVVGCSTSEVKGLHIGKGSDIDAAAAILEGILPVLREQGIFLAAQCCEHLNRAIIIERAALLPGTDIANVVPQIHAGGSFATTFYKLAEDPVAVESIRADAGIDIGDTLIGMHLRPVAVPVRISIKKLGEANLVLARTRPKFIGGSRAVYDEALSGGDIRR